VFQNYISKDVNAFFGAGIQQGSCIDLLFKLISKVLQITKSGHSELDAVVAMKLLITLIDNLPQNLSALIENILTVVVQELGHAATDNYKAMLIQTISMCFWYNTVFTLQILEKNNWTGPVFQMWFQILPNLKQDFERRRVLFGLCSIINQDFNTLPQLIQGGLRDIIKQSIEISGKIITERENPRIREIEEEAEVVDDEEKELGTTNAPEKEGDFDDEDDPEFLDYDDEDDEDYTWNGGDLDLYKSPLDNIDELMFFRNLFEDMSINKKEKYQVALSLLMPEDREKIGIVAQKALQLYNQAQEALSKIAAAT